MRAGVILRSLLVTIVMVALVHLGQALFCLMADLLSTPVHKKNVRIESSPASKPEHPKIPPNHINRTRKQFLPDGSIHLTYYGDPCEPDKDKKNSMYSLYDMYSFNKIYILDVNGTLLWQGHESENPFQYMSWINTDIGHSLWKRSVNQSQEVSADFTSTIDFPVHNQKQLLGVWRYDISCDDFEKVDPNGRIEEYLGSNGPALDKSHAKSFGRFKKADAWYPPEAEAPCLLWLTKRYLYEINFDKRTVELLFDADEASIIRVMHDNWKKLPKNPRDYYRYVYSNGEGRDEKHRPLVLCQTDNQQYTLILRNPNEIIRVDLPAEWEHLWHEPYRIANTENGLYLKRNWAEHPAMPKQLSYHEQELWNDNFKSKSKTMHLELYQIRSDGTLVLKNQLTWDKPDYGYRRLEQTQASPIKRFSPRNFSRAISPITYTILIHTFGIYQWNDIIRYWHPRFTWSTWIAILMMGGFIYWHSRSRSVARHYLALWLSLSSFFGFAGLLTYLALNHTPLVRCINCKKGRCLSQANCVHCGTPLPRPNPKHTIIGPI